MSSGTTKATDVVLFKHKLLEKFGAEGEKRLEASLSPEALKAYRSLMPVTRIPLEIEAEILSAGAAAFFPGDPRGLFRLVKQLAQDSITGVYKVFIRIPTVAFAIKRIPLIWRTYYDRGQARTEEISPKSGDIIVTDFPDLPRATRESIITGYIAGGLELLRARNIHVKFDGQNPGAWRWHVSWE